MHSCAHIPDPVRRQTLREIPPSRQSAVPSRHFRGRPPLSPPPPQAEPSCRPGRVPGERERKRKTPLSTAQPATGLWGGGGRREAAPFSSLTAGGERRAAPRAALSPCSSAASSSQAAMRVRRWRCRASSRLRSPRSRSTCGRRRTAGHGGAGRAGQDPVRPGPSRSVPPSGRQHRPGAAPARSPRPPP